MRGVKVSQKETTFIFFYSSLNIRKAFTIMQYRGRVGSLYAYISNPEKQSKVELERRKQKLILIVLLDTYFVFSFIK